MAAYPLPPTDLYSRQQIRILHPGYPFSNALLSLPRVDRAADNTAFGVHHGMTLLACQIIAGNAFDTGRLFSDQAGQCPVELLLDDILTEDIYYFMVGNGPSQYPVVPSFRDWEFPHGRIPDSWPDVYPTLTSSRCVISNYSFAAEEAHLIPKNETLWYHANDMGRYADAILEDINNTSNILPLKSDLHKCFDDRWFAIVPKVIGTTTPYSPQYVTHILRQRAAELWPSYHNIIVQRLPGMSRPYLFARFAWTILLQVKPFIKAGLPRYIIRARTNDDGMTEYKEELLSGTQLQSYYGGGGSQGATPVNKRSKSGSAVDEDKLEGSSSEDDDVNMGSDREDMVLAWREQGKKERKQKSSETTVDEDNQAYLLAELKTHLEEVLPRSEDSIPQQEE